MFLIGQLIRSLGLFFKTASYELNWKHWLAILAILAIKKSEQEFREFFIVFLLLGPSPDKLAIPNFLSSLFL
jgi:hypothetical protein